jgi:hypothetical protein
LCDTVDFQNRADRIKAHEEKLQDLAISSRFAIAVLGQSKTQLIDMVNSMDEGGLRHADEFLQCLVNGRKMTEAILEFITAAEHRITVALAKTIPA